MNELEWDRVNMEKRLQRRLAAAIPFSEKLRMLERLRERDRAFKAYRALQTHSVVTYEARAFHGRGPQPAIGSIRLTMSGASAAFLAAAGLLGQR